MLATLSSNYDVRSGYDHCCAKMTRVPSLNLLQVSQIRAELTSHFMLVILFRRIPSFKSCAFFMFEVINVHYTILALYEVNYNHSSPRDYNVHIQVNVFLDRTSGEAIGFTVIGVMTIDRNSVISVSSNTTAIYSIVSLFRY